MRVTDEHGLDLLRVDIRPPGDEPCLHSAHHIEPSILRTGGEVTGLEPAVSKGGVTLEITERRPRSPDGQGPIRAESQFHTIQRVVENPHGRSLPHGGGDSR